MLIFDNFRAMKALAGFGCFLLNGISISLIVVCRPQIALLVPFVVLWLLTVSLQLIVILRKPGYVSQNLDLFETPIPTSSAIGDSSGTPIHDISGQFVGNFDNAPTVIANADEPANEQKSPTLIANTDQAANEQNTSDKMLHAYGRTEIINGHRYQVKYCHSCKSWRPPRASHCAYCDRCIESMDHHCVLYVNKALG